jgi:hypothetical protein
VSDSVEGGLTRRQRARVRRHLRGCRHCDRYLRQIRTTISVTGHVRVEDLESMPAGVRDDLLGAFREGRPG